MPTLSINSDYLKDKGSAEPYLRQIAAAGFSHVHWCHHWDTDYLYAPSEINQAQRWLHDFGLQLRDLHASEGVEKYWLAPEEYIRLAGLDLIRNRIQMTAQLGGEVIVLHVQPQPKIAVFQADYWQRLRRSLDALQPFARQHGVRLALENQMFDNYATIEKALTLYPPDFLGVCFDSGHGNFVGGGLAFLERVAARLLVVHLHDNDGQDDQHNFPFRGSVDWAGLIRLLAASAYQGPITLEVHLAGTGLTDEMFFLRQARLVGTEIAQMLVKSRQDSSRLTSYPT